MKEKISHPPLMPSVFMGEEYPAHFHFFDIDSPQEGQQVGTVNDFYPDINEQCKDLPSTKLVWKGGCVNQVSS